MPNNIRHAPFSQVCASPSTSGSRGLARLHAVAAAVLLCTSLSVTGEAQALALGRIVVQSALGEPLRAEIDVPEITAEEAASLRVGVAPVDAFRAAGMDINPALGELQVSLQRRPDGRQFLRLTSPRPVSEPFMDMILEASWASGRIVRDYTLLFDPPNLRQAAATPLAPGVSAPAAPSAPTAVQAPTRSAPPPAPATASPSAPRAAAPAPRPVQAPRPAPERTTAPAPVAAEGGQQQRVRAGDTASLIATRNLPANVSLDQMLVAMLRSNPNAFIGGNINRIKAGSVLDMPGQSQADAIPAAEARQVIAAQSRDFNDFRRRLANKVPTAAVATADRQTTGRVQAEVEDKKPAPPTQDKLTLSKGATPTQTAKEDKIAQERQSKEAASRAAELSRNIEELAKLGTSTAAATTPAVAAAGTPTAPSLSVPGAVATTTAAMSSPTVAVATPTATVAAAPTETTAAPAAPAAQTPTAAAPAPAALPEPAPEAEEPGFMAQLMENPLVLPAAGGLLALLAGLGIYRLRQRKKGPGVDSSFLESRLQPDSFFGSSGGQRIDTAEAAASGSSMVYSPSQLDAAGDVDPVAEADVYLAYGRDLQAEEILKEAMRSTPTRVAIHNKLLEIYAKRRDAKAFEVVATEAYGLTQGAGTEWEHACELGKELDPNNPLYQPGGSPAPKPGAPAGAVTVPFGSSTLAQHTRPGAVPSPNEIADLNLALDLDLDEPSGHAELTASAGPASADAAMSDMDDLNSTETLTRAAAPAATEEPSGPPSMSMDFDLDFPSEPIGLAPAAPPAMGAPASAGSDTPTFDDNEVLPDFALDAPPALTPVSDDTLSFAAPANEPVAPPPSDMLAFDLSDINLDLDEKAPAQPALEAEPSGLGGLTAENPLETKLSLAEEFRAIGDLEGARSLAEEVLAEASGSLKSKASAFLNDLA
ncbi:FimV/HubP family polar landmark protein [Hydrogenophaga sp.]|uniref:FimV/HubP family polar landmark protein n=1 Tax=Hydrogenophaga sp. TaxID=1904254 RepID=UPI00286D95F3|nr:FimV/HubP family polar landmark protein [Hydrogenophaga sp.]